MEIFREIVLFLLFVLAMIMVPNQYLISKSVYNKSYIDAGETITFCLHSLLTGVIVYAIVSIIRYT